MVRRGRNNRILTRAIVQNIFEDNLPEIEAADKQIARSNRGQKHYLSKYEKLWSMNRQKSNERDDVYQLEPARKRARKSTVFETCLEDLPQSLRAFAIQRSLAYKRGTRKLGEFRQSELIQNSGKVVES